MTDRERDPKSDPLVAGGTGETGDVLKRKRRARPPAEVAAERLLSGAAWSEFCCSLERAGKVVLEANPTASAGQRAEGFRYLTGLVNAAIRFAVDFSDPVVPKFFRSPDSRTQWGGENADNQYLLAGVVADATYRMTGTRGTAFEFLIEVKEGFMQLGDDRIFETVAASDLVVDADGGFEISFSAERPVGYAGNWIRLHPETKLIVIRQYFLDWENEIPATFFLERVGAEGAPPTPLTAARMSAVLDDAGEWVEASMRVWNQWVERIRADHRPGQIVPAVQYVGGAETIRYGNDWYRLARDEAMIVETDVPQARYWAFQLCGVWFEGRDYANRQTSINNQQAYVDSDGRFRCVLAHADPGVPNWLDTSGQEEGLLQYRWIWTRDNPRPTCRIVKADEVRAHLPGDTPVVAPSERRLTIAARRRHMHRREA
jgi:hypothetical protein